MWPRVAEIVIGLWLAASPWLLAQEGAPSRWPINSLVCGIAVVLLSVVSFLPRWKSAHLAEIPLGLWVLGFAYFGATHPAPAVAQSHLLAALFLLNFAIIPSHANRPPSSWRELKNGTSLSNDVRGATAATK